ncbi:MAG TPA: diacylglycerol kinase family protein [Polyangiaceae bacterium]|jgi:diacylglycerol kinase (ATP)|nr:diacylglycerol kinase family protein [Polyangiaceae bacterium]
MAQARRFSPAARLRSFVYAGRGLWIVLSSQHNSWIHATATLLVVAAGVALGVSRLEWLALLLAMALVWSAEAFNTAIELVSDAAQPEFHPLIQKAKDVAAGAVLISALGALAVGALVFVPHLF